MGHLRRFIVGLAGLALVVGSLPAAALGADNTPPVAVDDPGLACNYSAFGGSFPIAEDWNDWIGFVGPCGPLANDSDADGDPLTFELIGQPSHGEAVSLPDGFLAYRVEADYSTPRGDVPGGTWDSDQITYRLSDGTAYSEPAQYHLWIAPVNDPPTFTPGPASVEARAFGDPVSLPWASNILAGPPNEAGQIVSFQFLGGSSGPSGMFASPPQIDANGVLTFTPGSESGVANLIVEAKDDGGLEDYGLRGRREFVPPRDTSAQFTLQIVIRPAVSIPEVSLAAPDTPTNASTLTYGITFSEPIFGLGVDDFSVAGTAAGCAVGPPVPDGRSYSVAVTGCSDGTVELTLAERSVRADSGDLGPAAPTSADIVLVDRTPPTVTTPTVPAIVTPQVAGQTSTTLSLSWMGADGGSGVVTYDVERSMDEGTWAAVASQATPSLQTNASFDASVQYRVRARDLAGNVSGWAYTTAVTPLFTSETSSTITYGGPWSTATASGYLDGSIRYATRAGTSASYRFTGRAIAWVAAKGPTRGSATVFIDGRYIRTISLYARTTSVRQVVLSRTWSSSGTHTIRIVVSGTSRHPRVDLDGLLRLR